MGHDWRTRARQHVDIRRSVDTEVSTHLGGLAARLRAVMSTITVDDARAASMIFDAVRCHDAPPMRCIDAARASTPLPSTSRRPKTKANVRADNRVAVRRYRERRRTEEKERRTECERLRAENETLRLKLATIEAELKHSRWLLGNRLEVRFRLHRYSNSDAKALDSSGSGAVGGSDWE